MQRREEDNRYIEKLVAVNRVSKTVKGGRNMRFSALMVVGDTENPGTVGCGMGKAVEIPEAIRKGLEDAKKSMVTIPLNGTTIPHEVVGVFGTGKVKMLPAPEGTGVIAGGPARSVVELAGIKNIRAKSLGSNNKQNVVLAVMDGLKQLKTPAEVARLREKTIEEVTA
ncbi:MAG: 30S ribosomal protein S5 [Lachnospiraceae bacterium]|nr:30S ribosomal protein S5 [Lachnospiraceae bacterium]